VAEKLPDFVEQLKPTDRENILRSVDGWFANKARMQRPDPNSSEVVDPDKFREIEDAIDGWLKSKKS
jgi:hypothetical protein